jgi:hypothetical protein
MSIQASISAPELPTVSARRPVFLHSGYRSGSTWFWDRFRRSAGAYGYCEPFNVKLATLTPGAIESDRPDAWPSGHPETIRPYSEEYAPLLAPAGGVLLYQPRFGVETYYNTGADPDLARYLGMLVRHALRRGRLPVLGFCCSLGRVEWFRRHTDAWNIVTWRNPRDQWMSSHRQWTEHGNFSFEVHPLLAAYIGRLTPSLAPFFADLGPLPAPDAIAPTMPLFADPAGVAQRFRVFLRVFVIDMLLAIQHADLLVDLDALSEPGAYRTTTTLELRAISALDDLSFEDCRLPQHAFGPDADYDPILRQERAFIDRLAASPDAARFDKSLPFVREKLAELAG